MANLDFELTLILQRLEDESILGRILFFPEVSILGGRAVPVRKKLKIEARRILEGLAPLELHRRRRGVPVTVASAKVELAPARRCPEWRAPVELEVPYVHWNHGTDASIASIPSLDIEVLAGDEAELHLAVPREILAAINRLRLTDSLERVIEITRSTRIEVRTVTLAVPVESPRHRAIRELGESQVEQSVLEQVATDLVKASLPPAFEAEATVARMVGAFGASRPESVLLIGPSGVGKTAGFHELVRQRALHQLGHTPFWATSGARLVAGMSGFGLWQERCLALCREAARTRAIVHLGNLIELMEVGKSTHNAQGIGSFLRTAIARGDLLAVVECTPEQVPLAERLDPHLLECFQRVIVEEPGEDAGRRILQRCHDARGAADGVRLDLRALSAVDRLHRKYATYSCFPGRPLRFLDSLMARGVEGTTFGESDVLQAFSSETGLPRFMLQDDQPLDLDATRRFFTERVIGQEAVADLVTGTLAAIKAGLTRPGRPIASFFFIGPTGVGKTETAKALATFLFQDPDRLTRFDMSEFSDPVSAQRLIGARGGSEGLLTARVREEPFSVVLLDEIEKADPGILDLLLQVTGEGRLTDGAGRTADFRNSVIILTSNLGAEDFARGAPGFATGQSLENRATSHFVEAVRAAVRPELFNRIDRVVPFLPLTRVAVAALVRRELEALVHRSGLRAREARVEIAEEVAARLIEVGHDPRYGARPLKRAIEREILAPLAAQLLSQPGTSATDVMLQVANGAISVTACPRDSQEGRPAVASWAREVRVLRREMQRLERSPAVARLANDAFALERMQRRRKGAPGHFDGEREARLARIRAMQDAVSHLASRIVRLEDEAMFALHWRADMPRSGRDHGIDLDTSDVFSLRSEYRQMLVALRSLAHPSPDRVLLMLQGDHGHSLFRLAGMYASLGEARGEIRVAAFRCRDGAVVREMVEKPAAYLRPFEDGVVGILLEIRAPGAGIRFEREAGIHRFKVEADALVGIQVDVRPEPLEEVLPAPGMARQGQVPASGPRRRLYDRVRRQLEDSALDLTVTWTDEALGSLLDKLLWRRLEEEVLGA